MVAYAPDARLSQTELAELLEQVGMFVAYQYQAAEEELIRAVAKYLRRGVDAPLDLMARITAVRELQREAERIVASINERELTQRAVTVGAQEGEAAAVRQIGFLPNVATSAPIPASAAQASAQISLSLTNSLTQMRSRITRWAPDIYQRTIARYATLTTTGVATIDVTRKQAVSAFIGEGVTGFTDEAGRNWRIGSYAEMATRTTVKRAWQDANIDRLTAPGTDIQLGTIVGGVAVCKFCAPWIGKVVSLDGTPAGTYRLQHATEDRFVSVTVKGSIDDARVAGFDHPNCFPGWVPVESTTGIAGANSRWYSGEVVRIRTASGREVTVTPNHPVLTSEGWVRAGAIERGAHVIRHNRGIEGVTVGAPDHEDARPSLIGDVFESLRKSGKVASVRMPGTTEQFHGDGVLNSDVDVVSADGLLGPDGEPAVLEYSSEGEFLFRGSRQPSLTGARTLGEVSGSTGGPADGVVGGSSEPGSFLGAGASHAHEHGVGTASGGDSGAQQDTADYIAGDSLSSGELLFGLAGQVSTDEVVDVVRYEWSGHVFNLQTGGGWYLADDLIVHNCRCTVVGYLPGLSLPRGETTYDPKAEADRDRLRTLERTVRKWKRREAAALDDVEAARARRKVREWQGAIRKHVADAGVMRDNRREQLAFSDGDLPRVRPRPVR